jgi:hypothetical protein
MKNCLKQHVRGYCLTLSEFSWLILLCLILRSAPALASPVPTQTHPASGPNLTDAAGWNQPAYYSTLQTADINGDGQNEIIARGKDGLHAWELVNGAWLETGTLPALSDAAGWNDPSYYQTLTFAHLQAGSRQMDLVARASDGIHVWRYEAGSRSWVELGASSERPLANGKATATSTDWTQPAHYANILVGDVNHDGVDELIARGQQGLQVYSWDAATSSWHAESPSGPLSDEDGFTDRSSYLSVQFVAAGSAATAHSYVVARSSSGLQVLEWQNGSWHIVSADGPFADAGSSNAPDLRMSVRTYVDSRGQLWVFGLIPQGKIGASMAVYRWDTRSAQWIQPGIIPLAGSGWERPSQYLTLRAADLWGDGNLELLARDRDGMHVYQPFPARNGRGDGKATWRQVQVVREMSDAHGYGLASSYYTIQTLAVKQGDGSALPGTVLLGRAAGGVEVYHNVGGALTSSTPLPAWHNANQQNAYAQISQELTGGSTSDIRSTYDVAASDYTYWKQEEFDLRTDYQKPPANFSSPGDWTFVYLQLDKEFLYVAAARAWFQNNTEVSNYIFDEAALQLTQVQQDESIQQSSAGPTAQVALNWAALIAQIGNQIFSAVDGPEATLVSGLLQDGLQAAANVVSGGSNNVTAAVDDIAAKLNNVQTAYTTANANQVTQYVTDWLLLQKIGTGSTGTSAPYTWGQGTTVNELAAAETNGALGQLLWMYKRVSNPAWHVYWCSPPDWIFGGCQASTSYPSQYIDSQTDYGFPLWTAYTVIRAYMYPYPSFDALRRLQTYNVNFNDMFTDCGGWDLDDPSPSDMWTPNSCGTASSALTAAALRQTLAAMTALRDRVKQESSAGAAGQAETMDAAIEYVQRHSQFQVAPNGGAPNAADVTRGKTVWSPYVDPKVPIQFLTSFVGINEAYGGDVVGGTEDSVVTQAYDLIGDLSDDGVALAGLGAPNN